MTKEEALTGISLKFYEKAVENKEEGWKFLCKENLLKGIEQEDAELKQKLHDFFFSLEGLSFVRGDAHMRLKALDLWREQVQMYKAIVQGKAQVVLQEAERLDLNLEEELDELGV